MSLTKPRSESTAEPSAEGTRTDPSELTPPQSVVFAPRRAGTASNQVINLIGRQGLVLGLALAANIIAARALLPAGRGALAFGLQAAFVASFAIIMGLDKSLAVVLPQRKLALSLPEIWRQARPRASVVALIGAACTAIALATRAGNPSVPIEPLLYGLPIAAMAIASAMNRTFEASSINAGRAQLTLLDAFVTGAITLSGVALLAFIDINHAAWWLAIYASAAGIVGLVLARRFGSVTRSRLMAEEACKFTTGDEASTLRSAGRTLFPASMASYAALRSDRLILPVLDGTESLGLYVVVATFTDLAATPVEAMANVLTPRWRRAQLEGRLKTRRVIAAVGIVLGVASVGAVVVGRVAVVPIFGDAYEPAIDLLPALAIGSALFGLGRLLAAQRLAEGYIKLVSSADVAGMVTSVASYLALIPFLGAMGAAIGSIIGYGTSLALLVAGKRWATAEAITHLDPHTP